MSTEHFGRFTSESVCAGHPDKVCDQISDAILDAALTQDLGSRVAVETLATTNKIVLAGEVTTKAKIDCVKIAQGVVQDLHYTNPDWGFYHLSDVLVLLHKQSPDIAQGVDNEGAGDQGMMFGYACNETVSLMPLPISLAHGLAQKIDQARTEKIIPYLRPDGKTEVTILYENGQPVGVERIILAVPHDPSIENGQIKEDLKNQVVLPILEKFKLNPPSQELIVNGTGRWEIGGPATDTGLTGRKIIVDTYGGWGRHGGGCFSGKDPTKVDRSGAYAARYLAKNIVAAGMADRCEVQIAYVIGQREPITTDINTFGTAKYPKEEIIKKAFSLLDLSVPGILEGLNLRQPIYRKTATYGHFGRAEFPWEKVIGF